MILNVFTLTLVFLSLLTLAFLLAGGGGAIFLKKRSDSSDSVEERKQLEVRLYLVFLLMALALLLRGLSWPLFYLMLQSFIPDVPGAMCIFGTTQVSPVMIRFLELLKPVSFFLIGAWFIVFRMDQTAGTDVLIKKNFILFWILCLVAVIDAAGDILLSLTFSPPGIPVSCCTVIGDIQFPAARIRTPSILGAQPSELGKVLYQGIHLVSVSIIAVLLITKRWQPHRPGHRAALLISPLLALAGLIISFIAIVDRFGPALMALPDHHCPYCLLQQVPYSIGFIGLELIGNFSLGWACIAGTLGRTGETGTISSLYVKRLWLSAAVCLSISWLMVMIGLQQ